MLTRTLAVSLLLAMPLFAHADELTSSKKADILKLMEITGNDNIPAQIAGAITQNMANGLKQARPEIPQRFYINLDKDLTAFFKEKVNAPGSLMEKTVASYNKYFTQAELKEILAFYQSPTGKKSITNLSLIVNEGMMEARKLAQSLGPDIEQRIKAAFKKEGIALPGPAPSAPTPAK
jgi:hypothetical protein